MAVGDLGTPTGIVAIEAPATVKMGSQKEKHLFTASRIADNMTEQTVIEQSYSMVDDGLNQSLPRGQNKISYREVVEEEELSDKEIGAAIHIQDAIDEDAGALLQEHATEINPEPSKAAAAMATIPQADEIEEKKEESERESAHQDNS